MESFFNKFKVTDTDIIDKQYIEQVETCLKELPAIMYIYTFTDNTVLYDSVCIKHANDYKQLQHGWNYLCNSVVAEVKRKRLQVKLINR